MTSNKKQGHSNNIHTNNNNKIQNNNIINKYNKYNNKIKEGFKNLKIQTLNDTREALLLSFANKMLKKCKSSEYVSMKKTKS